MTKDEQGRLRFVAGQASKPEEKVASKPDKGLISRLVGDVAAIVTSPYRFWRLASITKEEAAKAKEKVKSSPGSEETSKAASGAAKTLKAFLPTYMRSHVVARTPPEEYRKLLGTSLDVILDSVTAKELFSFEPYHKAVRGPDVDLYAWGNDFFRSMVKWRSSRVLGVEHVESIQKVLDAGENVIILANHQTEADPQVLSLLLQREGYEDIAEKCIFVAGHKVTTDRLTIPFSKGRNLLTIFSKKYLDDSSEEERKAKSDRNQATVGEMQRLMKEGGNIFWVAPSGGRDRKSPETGRFVPAAFDAQSVGLFQLLAHRRSGMPLSFTSHLPELAM